MVAVSLYGSEINLSMEGGERDIFEQTFRIDVLCIRYGEAIPYPGSRFLLIKKLSDILGWNDYLIIVIEISESYIYKSILDASEVTCKLSA